MSSCGQVVILDFDDSFTYNIAEVLHSIAIKSEVVRLREAFGYLNSLSKRREAEPLVVIYGPGPGHPDEYSHLYPLVKMLTEKPHIFTMGICLGHQLIWRALGADVVVSKEPVHGRKAEFVIPNWQNIFDSNLIGKRVFVQHYNSLVVDNYFHLAGEFLTNQLGECTAARFVSGVTYQFHPESIGTSCPQIFFHSVKEFLYNKH